MAVVTQRGRNLAWKINPFVGTTSAIEETCSLLARHAASYSRIQEAWCSVEMSDAATARLEAKESALEARIGSLVQDLPAPDDGPWRVVFEGDPRGWTVRIVTPDGREIGLDD